MCFQPGFGAPKFPQIPRASNAALPPWGAATKAPVLYLVTRKLPIWLLSQSKALSSGSLQLLKPAPAAWDKPSDRVGLSQPKRFGDLISPKSCRFQQRWGKNSSERAVTLPVFDPLNPHGSEISAFIPLGWWHWSRNSLTTGMTSLPCSFLCLLINKNSQSMGKTKKKSLNYL